MSLGLAFVAVLAVAAAAGWLGFAARQAAARTAAGCIRCRSITALMPRCGRRSRRLLLLAVWAPMQSRLVDQAVLASPEGRALPDFDMQRESILAEAREIAHGEREAGLQSGIRRRLRRASPKPKAASRPSAAPSPSSSRSAPPPWRFAGRAPQFRARTGVERWVMAVLLAASLIAILTTLGILLSLMFESLRFFQLYPVGSIPVRHRMEPADGDPRRPGRLVGRVRFGPAALGHLLHRRDHRDDRCHPARPDERDLPHPICARRACAPG